VEFFSLLDLLHASPCLLSSAFSGYEKELEVERAQKHLRVLLDRNLIQKRLQLGTPVPGALMLCSSRGCSKSTMALYLANWLFHSPEVYAHVVWVHCQDLVSETPAVVRKRFSQVAREAKQRAPSLIVFDDIDKLIPAAGGPDGGKDVRAIQLAEALCDTMTQHITYSPSAATRPVAVVATSKGPTTFHPTLMLPGLFTNRIDIQPPTLEGRKSILSSLLSLYSQKAKAVVDLQLSPDVNLEDRCSEMDGYSHYDLHQIVQRVCHAAAVRFIQEHSNTPHSPSIAPSASPITALAAVATGAPKSSTPKIVEIGNSDFDAGLNGFVPGNLKDVVLAESTVSWEDVGGLTYAKETLKETLDLPSRYARVFQQVSLKLRSGLLLYGPPGCGKTLLASAVAKECGLNFISIKGPELLNKYIGQSEASVREAFDRAAAAAPAILFFDEFEAIAPKRGGDSTGVTDRVVNQFLVQMDGVEGRVGVYVLAASARPDMIDPALLRPGRLDKSVYCNIPSESERASILKACARKVPTAPDVDWDDIARKTSYYSGADLQAIVSSAQLEVVHDQLDVSIVAGQKKPAVTQKHLLAALAGSSLSLSAKDRAKFDRIYEKFLSSRTDQSSEFDPSKGLRTALA